jgi:3-isopropylmalate/(R)-2-methylmalate dehydratase small subunit
VNLDDCTLSLPGNRVSKFPIDRFARYCLMNGVDELGYLRSQEAAIANFEAARA